ncbi:MAG: hypothetical protein WBA83_01545 [Burkholderiaceae bacterium]
MFVWFFDRIRVALLLCGASLACAPAWHLAWAAGDQFRELAPVQAYPAPQVSVDPPRPLPDTPGTEPMFSGMSRDGQDAAAPDISYDFFHDGDASAAWRPKRVFGDSPGLRGARDWQSSWRRYRSPWLARPKDTSWTLGASNWRYSNRQGLDVTLGNDAIVVPAWGNSARMGGVSISQSSLAAGDGQAWQYSMSVGALDYSSGSMANDLSYGPTASNTVLRYGLSPDVTLESQLELAPNLATSGLGGNYQTRWGAWSAGVARASYGLYTGWRYQAAYTVDVMDDVQLSWLNERHTAGFVDLSRYRDSQVSPGGVRQKLTAKVPLGRWGDVTGSYENEYSATGDMRRSFGVGQQFWYSPNLRIGLKAEREVISGDYDIGLRFSVPIY